MNKLYKMSRRKYRYFAVSLIMFICMYNFLGFADYMYTKGFEEFEYPLNIDIRPLVTQILSGKKANVVPINYYPYKFLTNSGKCSTIDKLDLFIAVKSSIKNFGHRQAIRDTFGQENLIPGRIIKVLFFLGTDKSSNSNTQKRIDQEMSKHKDIIQINFHDNYYNNTIKTMMTFRWVYEYCSTADFYLFTDDDMYISVRNLLEYVFDQTTQLKLENNEHMFAGYVFESSPLRHKTSKWRVSLKEYPYNKWPPYVTAGAYVVSNLSMKTLYVGSFFVKHFRFDDIYLGIVAKKVGIVPMHCPKFYFYKKKYSKEGYRDVIASHGYEDHGELVRVWTEQNSGGHFI